MPIPIKHRIAIAVAAIGAVATITAAVVSRLGVSSSTSAPAVNINIDIAKAIEAARREAVATAKPVEPAPGLKHLSLADRAFIIAAAHGVRQVAEMVSGVQIDSTTSVRDRLLKGSTVRSRTSHSFGSVQISGLTHVVDAILKSDVVELTYVDELNDRIASIRVEEYALTQARGGVSLAALHEALRRSGFIIEEFRRSTGTDGKAGFFALTIAWQGAGTPVIRVNTIAPTAQ